MQSPGSLLYLWKVKTQEENAVNKKSTTIIAVICAAVVIAVLCLAIVQFKNGNKEPVAFTQLSDITEISFNNGTDDLVFQKENGSWFLKADKNFPLDQQYLAVMEETISNITGDVVNKEAGDLSEYGLNEPIYQATAVTSDGTSTTILIGDLASGNSCFAMKEGEKTVYSIPTKLGEEAARPLYSMIETEKFPELAPAQINEIRITKHGKTLHFIKKGEGESGVWYRDSTDSEDNKIADTKDIESITAAITELKNTDCVNYKVVEKQLGNYGLDKPAETFLYSYEKDGTRGTVSLLVGSVDAKNEYYYTKLADSNQVNRISKGLIDPCLYTVSK